MLNKFLVNIEFRYHKMIEKIYKERCNITFSDRLKTLFYMAILMIFRR